MRCLVLVVSCLLLASLVSAQNVEVEYFACDTAKTIDLNSPTIVQEMQDLGIVADEGADPMAVVNQLIGQIVEKPFEFVAFAVRVTNKSTETIPLKPSTIQLEEGTWADTQPDFRGATRKPASGYNSWTGGLSLFAKAKELAPGASATGVVLFEQEPAAPAVGMPTMSDASMGMGMGGDTSGGMGMPTVVAVAPKNPQRVQYVPPKDLNVKAAEPQAQARLLDDLDLEWTIAASPAPPPGQTVIYPAMGNTGTKDDETPTRVGAPGAIRPAPAQAIAASPNIIGQPPAPAAMGGGMGMPGMGGMGGEGLGGPGMLPSAPGSTLPGMPGEGGGMPGMPGMPGAGGGLPGMPGMTEGGGLPPMPGALPPDTGRRPRRPGAAGEG